MRIVLDTAILVRAHDGAKGLARDLLLRIIESDRVLLISDEMLYELAKVLRYPRMLALHGLSEGRIYDYIGFLREATEIVQLNPLLITPIRDMNERYRRNADSHNRRSGGSLHKGPGFLRTSRRTLLAKGWCRGLR